MEKHIKIFDTTLRDGEQAPGFSMNRDEKYELALQLEHLGVDVIEAGFPICSEGDFISVRDIAKAVKNSTVAGLSRASKKDIARTWEAVQYAAHPRIHTFIATSDIHMEHKLKKSRAEVKAAAVEAVRYAASLCDDVEFSAEDASRSDPAFLCEIFEAVIAAGATVINVPDTVGYALPEEFGKLIARIRAEVPNIDQADLSVHCHDDLGMAVANSIVAVANGADQIECTINGIGERAGNAALEEVVMAMHTRRKDMHLYTEIQTNRLYPTSQALSGITGVAVQPNKAIVGQNAFAHEAGIHQDGVLKNPLNYEIMVPQSVGVPHNNIVLGKHSGRNALRSHLTRLGFEFTPQELDYVYQGFSKMADNKKIITDQDLIHLSTNGVTELGDSFVNNSMQHYLNR
jgi:2-isopropylmalate synthase